jgi:hypothetical protein
MSHLLKPSGLAAEVRSNSIGVARNRRKDSLQGNLLSGFGIDGPEDLAHASLTELGKDLKSTDPLGM